MAADLGSAGVEHFRRDVVVNEEITHAARDADHLS